MNKKGSLMLILYFFMGLFVVLFLGLIFVFGSAVVNWTADNVVPEISNLGSVGAANLTEAASYTITPVNNVIQSFTWVTGVLYVLLLVGLFGIVVANNAKPSNWLIGFYFVLSISLIFSAILVSNIYEEFYTGDDEFAPILKEHVALSNMILYSPGIFTVITFLMGIVLFSGMQREAFV